MSDLKDKIKAFFFGNFEKTSMGQNGAIVLSAGETSVSGEYFQNVKALSETVVTMTYPAIQNVSIEFTFEVTILQGDVFSGAYTDIDVKSGKLLCFY